MLKFPQFLKNIFPCGLSLSKPLQAHGVSRARPPSVGKLRTGFGKLSPNGVVH